MTDVPLLVSTGRFSMAKGSLRACEQRPGSSRVYKGDSDFGRPRGPLQQVNPTNFRMGANKNVLA